MKLPVINIGNAEGFRLSKTIAEQCHISRQAALTSGTDYVVLKAKREARKDWDQAFVQMHDLGDDQILIDDMLDSGLLLL
jgi:antitoxin MazE